MKGEGKVGAKKGKSNKSQLLVAIIDIVVIVAFVVYSYVFGRGYFKSP